MSLIGILLLFLLGLFGASTGSSSSGSGTATPAAVPCHAAQLSPRLALQGAAGSREGVLIVRNDGPRCALIGPARARVIAKGQGKLRQLPPSQGPRTGLLMFAAGTSADARVRWSNWCGGPARRLVFVLHGNQQLVVPFTDAPPCNGPGLPSTIEVGTFSRR